MDLTSMLRTYSDREILIAATVTQQTRQPQEAAEVNKQVTLVTKLEVFQVAEAVKQVDQETLLEVTTTVGTQVAVAEAQEVARAVVMEVEQMYRCPRLKRLFSGMKQ